jgi:hypothetical protein
MTEIAPSYRRDRSLDCNCALAILCLVGGSRRRLGSKIMAMVHGEHRHHHLRLRLGPVSWQRIAALGAVSVFWSCVAVGVYRLF